MNIRFYYDLTWEPGAGGAFTSDTEGQLVMLCRTCAAEAGAQVAWAGDADDDTAVCETCGARNDDDDE